MSQAREGHDSLGSFRAWSAVFVSACVRGAAISEGIEAVTTPGRTHAGLDRPLRPSFSHAAYVIRARADRAAGRLGRYHAFVPSARAPQLADIIVQDRRDNIGPGQVRALATLPQGAETHGDIVVEVGADSVVTIGGNVADGVRQRRFPRDTTSGLLVTTVPQLYRPGERRRRPALHSRNELPGAGRQEHEAHLCAAQPGRGLPGRSVRMMLLCDPAYDGQDVLLMRDTGPPPSAPNVVDGQTGAFMRAANVVFVECDRRLGTAGVM